VQHPGETHVLDVAIGAAHLLGDVGRGTRVPTIRYASRGLGTAWSARLRGSSMPPCVGELLERSIERFPRHEVGIADGAVRVFADTHDTLGHREIADGRVEPLGRERKQHAARARPRRLGSRCRRSRPCDVRP
jgi:hypothetical protein